MRSFAIQFHGGEDLVILVVGSQKKWKEWQE